MNKLGRRSIRRASGAIALALCALCAIPAGAQDATNTVVVCDKGSDYYPLFKALYTEVYEDLNDGLDRLRTLQASGYKTLWVIEKKDTDGKPAPWIAETMIVFGSTDEFKILGFPGSTPQNVIIKPKYSSDPVVTFNGSKKVFLEGVTLTGGSTGVKVVSGTANVSRCYIRNNSDDGVLVNAG